MPTPPRSSRVVLSALCTAVLSVSTALTAAPVHAAPVRAAAAPTGDAVLVVSTSAAAARASVERAGGAVHRSYPLARAVSATLPAGSQVAGAQVVADTALVPSDHSGAGVHGAQDVAALLGAPDSQTGAGVVVAVVDTGVADVEQLRDAVAGRVDLSGAGAGDGYGHGTFMAGLIAARGVDGVGRGVAPGAKILDVRVADDTGSTSLLKVLAGIEAVAAAHASDARVRVMSLSMSIPDTSRSTPAAEILEDALHALQQEGVSVVVPAGNEGPRPGSITSPGSSPALLSVGALDTTPETDAVATFSGQGSPSLSDPRQVDLVAPGVSVIGVRSPGSAVDAANPQARIGTSQFRGSGTSMSSAVTAGAAAAVISRSPSLSPAQVAASITLSARPVPGASREAGGAGALSLGGAVERGAQILSSGMAAGEMPELDAQPGDVQAWETFATAWESGDQASAARAWAALTPSTRQWATRAFQEALWRSGSPEVQARAWSARAWSGEEWVARAWSARSWVDAEWAARAWSARAWSARAWSARAWSGRAWSARAWSGRAWSGRAWSEEEWAGRAWSARAWSTAGWR